MTKQHNTVVGVFINEGHAQGAVQKLRSSGLNAQLADSSATQIFKNTDLEPEVVQLYESRVLEGCILVIAHPGTRRDQALDIMLDSDAEHINLNTVDSAAQAPLQSVDRAAQDTRLSTAENAPGSRAAWDHQQLNATLREFGRVDRTTGHAKTAADVCGQYGS